MFLYNFLSFLQLWIVLSLTWAGVHHHLECITLTLICGALAPYQILMMDFLNTTSVLFICVFCCFFFAGWFRSNYKKLTCAFSRQHFPRLFSRQVQHYWKWGVCVICYIHNSKVAVTGFEKVGLEMMKNSVRSIVMYLKFNVTIQSECTLHVRKGSERQRGRKKVVRTNDPNWTCYIFSMLDM